MKEIARVNNIHIQNKTDKAAISQVNRVNIETDAKNCNQETTVNTAANRIHMTHDLKYYF